jgi:Zn-dependent peptidase ImmA (M78 family)
VASGGSPRAIEHFTHTRPEVFDAAVVPAGNGCFIVENLAHAPTRRRNTMSHEMSHVVLEHPYTPTLVDSNGCRTVNSEIEEEAACLAAELLIPYEAALAAAREGLSDEDVARKYCVSPRLAAWRMNASGARKVAGRQRRFWR